MVTSALEAGLIVISHLMFLARLQPPRLDYLARIHRECVVLQGAVAEAFQILAEPEFKGEFSLSIMGSWFTVDAGRQRRQGSSRNRCGGRTGQ